MTTTTDTVKPLTAEQASEAARIVADYAAEHDDQSVMAIADALLLIRGQAHEAVPHEELDRLRADARRLDFMERSAEIAQKREFDGIRSVWFVEPMGTDRTFAQGSLRGAIDYAQQEEQDHE